MPIAYLKHSMKTYLRFLKLLRATDTALSTWMISLASNMPTDFALSGVVPRTAIDVNFEPQRRSGCSMADFDWFPMR